jgi:hypothetical protein
MATIHFNNDDVRRSCCDAAVMTTRFGAAVALRISHRLQQLEAIASIEDVAFLPLDHRPVEDGIEVTIVGDLALLIATTHEGAHVMNQTVITILGIHATSATSR